MFSISERRLAKVELPSPPQSTAVAEFLGGVQQKSDSGSGRGQACSKFPHDGGLPNLIYLLGISESTITSLSEPRGDHAFARRYCWPGSNYPVTLHDCSPGPPPGAARAAEASLPVPRSPRAAFSLSGASPIPGSRRPLSRFAASDVCPFSWAYAADFGVISSVGHYPHSCFEPKKNY